MGKKFAYIGMLSWIKSENENNFKDVHKIIKSQRNVATSEIEKKNYTKWTTVYLNSNIDFSPDPMHGVEYWHPARHHRSSYKMHNYSPATFKLGLYRMAGYPAFLYIRYPAG